jgi:hypothetical protein
MRLTRILTGTNLATATFGVQPRRGAMFIETSVFFNSKPQRGGMNLDGDFGWALWAPVTPNMSPLRRWVSGYAQRKT